MKDLSRLHASHETTDSGCPSDSDPRGPSNPILDRRIIRTGWNHKRPNQHGGQRQRLCSLSEMQEQTTRRRNPQRFRRGNNPLVSRVPSTRINWKSVERLMQPGKEEKRLIQRKCIGPERNASPLTIRLAGPPISHGRTIRIRVIHRVSCGISRIAVSNER